MARECVIVDLHGNVMGIEARAGLDETTHVRACSTLADMVTFPPAEETALGTTAKLMTFGAAGRTLTVTARALTDPPGPEAERWKV
jgi:hypothetical protein